ncbi:MAG: ATP synthase F0 subunit B [Deltaproteobacteria bacterium]|nr:ATP synthase F0 subunit B [Deltaproteobacteria bacterium]
MRTLPPAVPSVVLASLVLLPALAFAGGEGGGHGATLKEHGYSLVNFLVFVGLLYLLAGERIRAAVRDRSRAVGADLRDAGAAMDQATAREAAARDALEGLPGRSREIEEAFIAEGERLARTVAERIDAETAKLRRAAEATLIAERAATQRTLARELARRTLDQTEALLEAGRNSLPQDRLFQDFVVSLEQDAPGGRP